MTTDPPQTTHQPRAVIALPEEATPKVEYDKFPCYFCGRATTGTRHFRIVEYGDGIAVNQDDPSWDGDPGDLGYFPVGPDCATNHLPATAVLVS